MKDLFAEIFYSVLDNLKTEYDELSRYLPLDTEKTIYKSSMCRITEKLLDVLLDIGKYYTPINQDCWKDYFDKCHPELKNGFYINSESLVSESLTKLASCITGDRDSFIMHCCTETFSIPLFSDITMFDHEIKNKFPVCGMDECCCSDDIARLNNSNNQELFPKNRMIIEGIEKMNFNSHRAFASLESVNEAIDDLQLYADLAAEGADAMASNSVYSNLGSICGGITSLEITNESTTDQDKINVDENTSKILDAANTDADGNLIAAGTNDTLDVANLTHHSVESAHAMVTNETKDMLFNAAAERFNKVFNSVILGLN